MLLSGLNSALGADSQGAAAITHRLPGELAAGDCTDSGSHTEGAAVLMLPELLLLTASFMQPEELLLLSGVCRTWRDASLSPMLWKDVVCQELARACHCDEYASSHWQHGSATRIDGAGSDGCSSASRAAAADAGPAASEQQALAHLGPALSLPRLWVTLHNHNLLRNPGFHRLANLDRASWYRWRRSAWVNRVNSGEDGIQWECPPMSCARLEAAPKPHLAGSSPGAGFVARVRQQLQGILRHGEEPGCIATTDQWMEVMQVIDFVEELTLRGLTKAQAEHVLDAGLPLGFSIQVGSRLDAAGEFSVCLFLLEEEGEDVLNVGQRFVPKPSRYCFYSGNEDLRTTRRSEWQRFAHVVDRMPKGSRCGVVLLRGKECSEAGLQAALPTQHTSMGRGLPGGAPRGVKFACAELSFINAGERATFAKGDGVADWIGRMQT